MSWKVPLADVRVSAAQRAAVIDVLDRGWLSMGPETAACETAWKEASGAQHAFLCTSGTGALWLALASLGVGAGDEVIVPALTFVADANVVVRLGATPVFADVVSPRRPVLDPAAVAASVTERTKAILVVHYGGWLADVDGIRAAAPGIPVVEDAAHAAGPLRSGTWPGASSQLACYSFFANKNLGVGEGGMVCTDDDELARRIRLLRSHGMDSLTWDRHRGLASSYDVLEPGLNLRPSELVAALVRTGLEHLPLENDARRGHLTAYRPPLADAGLEMIFDAEDDTAAHLAVVLVPSDRDGFRQQLAEAGIQTSFHYPPIHRFTWYEHLAAELPQTEAACARYATLPLWGTMSESQRSSVVEAAVAASLARTG